MLERRLYPSMKNVVSPLPLSKFIMYLKIYYHYTCWLFQVLRKRKLRDLVEQAQCGIKCRVVRDGESLPPPTSSCFIPERLPSERNH